MGQGVMSRIIPKKETNVLIVGMYGAGKTTLLHQLKGDISETIPTIGLTVETAEYKSIVIRSWDIGGRAKIRPLYRHFYRMMDAFIFVIDSDNRDQFFEFGAKEQFQQIIGEEELQNLPFLVLANKQDLPGAMTWLQLREDLEMNSIRRDGPVAIFPISAESGEGLPEALAWLGEQLQKKELYNMLVQPLEKAVPPSVTSTYSSVSSALKQAFGFAKKKLSHISISF